MKKLIFYLIVIALGSHTSWAQCGNDDYECWMTEIVHQIENQNFKTKGKPFRRATKKDAPAEIRNAAESLRKNRIKGYYKPLSEFKKKVIDKHSSKFYKDALIALRKGESKATKNLTMTNRFTKALDNEYLSFFQERISKVEQEREIALDEALETALGAFDGGEYTNSAKNFEFFIRESEDNNPNRSEAQEKLRQSKYYMNYDLASNAYDTGKYEVALTFIQKAISYWDDPEGLNKQIDIARAGYEQMIRTAESKVASDPKQAIKEFEESRKFYDLADKSDLPEEASSSPDEYIAIAKETAAHNLLTSAIKAHTSGDAQRALNQLNASMGYSESVTELYGEDEQSFSAKDLLTIFYEEKQELGVDEFNAEAYDASLKSFKAAGIYGDKDLMENNVLFVRAVKDAMKYERTSAFQSSASGKQRLANAWQKAKSLADGITFTSNLNIDEKYHEASEAYNDTASRESRDNESFLRRELVPLNISDDVLPIKLRNSKDDKGFGGDAKITAYIEFRVNHRNPTKLQARIFVEMRECCHHSFSGGNTIWDVQTESIDIGEIPAELQNNFEFGDFEKVNYKFKEYFLWDDKELNNLHIKGPPSEMRLRLLSNRVVDAKIFSKAGWKFSFDTAPIMATLHNTGTNSSSMGSTRISNTVKNYPITQSIGVMTLKNTGIETGKTYTIQSAIAGKHLDVQWAKTDNGTPFHLWPYNGDVAQRFSFEDAGDGYYYIKSELGKYIHVQGESSSPRALALLWEGKGKDNTKWKFEDAGKGYHYIKSKKGTYLDVKGGQSANETPIWMWNFNGGDAQKWKLKPLN